MPSLTPQDFQMLVEQFNGDESAARAAMAERGYTVEGEGGSLAAREAAPGAEDGGEEAPSDLSARPDMASLAGILKGQRQSIGDLYDKITQNIQTRYRKPDINDLLVAIGTGMMSAPGENDSGGFGGSLQRGLRGIGTYAQNRRGYETDMNKMLSQVEVQKAKDIADLESKYLSALKPSTGSEYTYLSDRGGYGPKPGVGGNAPMPKMDQFGNYVITDQRQIVYLPPNTPIVLPGGDPAKPKYTRAGSTR